MEQEESGEGRTFYILHSSCLFRLVLWCCFFLLHGGGSRDLKGPLVIFGLNDEVSRGNAGILRSKLDQKVRALFAIQTPFGRFHRPIARRCVRSEARPKIGIAHEGILEDPTSRADRQEERNHYFQFGYNKRWKVPCGTKKINDNNDDKNDT